MRIEDASVIFVVRFLAGAQEDLGNIDEAQQQLILRKSNEFLSTNPFPHGNVVKQLTGIRPPLSRLRIGDWRAFFEIHGSEVFILAIAKKERAERTIRRLCA